MDGSSASWVPAAVVALIAVADGIRVRIVNGRNQAKLEGRLEQKVVDLCNKMISMETSLQRYITGDCPVSKRVDSLEGNLTRAHRRIDSIIKGG